MQSCTCPPQPITTFILVRHAEKAGDPPDDPGLTEKGRERAGELVHLLKEAAVDAIYSTPFSRVRQTVDPLSVAKGIPVSEYKAFEPEEIEQMIEAHRGGLIVVAGHSDSIPWTANLLTGQEMYSKWNDEDYDNVLFVDVVEKGKAAKVTWLNYGL